MAILTFEQLENLKTYKYKSSSSSFLEPFLEPFWNFVVECLPLSIAPNLITFVGFLFNVSALLLILHFDKNFDQPAPNFVYLYAALAFFMAQTLDAIDGKQARRTNSSSCLGQLFDHVLDSFATTCHIITFFSHFSLGSSLKGQFVVFTAFFGFLVNNWEETITGEMRFGVFGLTEAQIILIVILAMAGINGTDIYSKTVHGIYTLKDCVFVIYIFSNFFITGQSVFVSIKTAFSNKNFDCLKMLIQVLIYNFLWLLILSYGGKVLYESNVAIVLLTYGIGNSFMISELIINRCTSSGYYFFDLFHIPLLFTSFIFVLADIGSFSQANFIREKITFEMLLLVLFMFNVSYSLIYAYLVVNEIAEHIGIYVFSITSKKKTD